MFSTLLKQFSKGEKTLKNHKNIWLFGYNHKNPNIPYLKYQNTHKKSHLTDKPHVLTFILLPLLLNPFPNLTSSEQTNNIPEKN